MYLILLQRVHEGLSEDSILEDALQVSTTSPMSINSIKLLISTVAFLMFASNLVADDSFPNWTSEDLFRADLRTSALIANLPNMTEESHYLGISSKLSRIQRTSDFTYYIPTVRMSVYPNPGYNLWAQFSKWPGEQANFSVGTGIQVEFPGENDQRRKAIGASWNEIYAEDYTQRDISVHGLFGLKHNNLSYGLMAIIDLHHVLVDDSRGIADYDKTGTQLVPYANWMFRDQVKVSVAIPLDASNAALTVGLEYHLGMRE